MGWAHELGPWAWPVGWAHDRSTGLKGGPDSSLRPNFSGSSDPTRPVGDPYKRAPKSPITQPSIGLKQNLCFSTNWAIYGLKAYLILLVHSYYLWTCEV